MVEFIQTVQVQNGSVQTRAKVAFPDECPVCRVALQPHFVAGNVLSGDRGQATFRCGRNVCGEYFVATYDGISISEWRLLGCQPKTLISRTFTDEIKTLSPDFVAIYNEAIAAESHGLTALVGVGLRKALEFLVKDFCVSLDSAKTESIKKKFLGDVINDDVTDPRLKDCAQRAAWLGNDETHYERRWVGKDVSDLKVLIDLTLHWVESELLTAKFKKEMPGGGKS